MSVAGSGATTGLAGISKLLQVVAAGVVRRASGLARAVALEVQVTCAGVAAAHEIGDVFKKAATGLPRILSRRVSKPAHPIVTCRRVARVFAVSGEPRGGLTGLVRIS
ncbi:hypothetical protein PR003_g12336 [Phytophthora rubi]|uniref:Uncharacterized protein n=1 Tax=Phytophthora rubi TaxID=129364 RepID=A0A6A4F8N6_9STRA|nr:hypothetical protein PR003_g12336 [Phytophthora rubi]